MNDDDDDDNGSELINILIINVVTVQVVRWYTSERPDCPMVKSHYYSMVEV